MPELRRHAGGVGSDAADVDSGQTDVLGATQARLLPTARTRCHPITSGPVDEPQVMSAVHLRPELTPSALTLLCGRTECC